MSYHDVLRFEVPVDDVKRVQKPNSNYQLKQYFGSIILAQDVVLFDVIEEVSALHQLSDDVHMGLSLDAFFVLEQERVRDHLHYAALVPTLKTQIRDEVS
jgi:hypothetical protein